MSGRAGGGDTARLGIRAIAWRFLHGAWSVAQLAALADVWHAAVRRPYHRRAWVSAAFLATEGVGLVIGRGNCPMGARQVAWGDPVPFFELFLPRRAAKAAIPCLTVVAIAGIALLAVRAAPRGRRRLGREPWRPDLSCPAATTLSGPPGPR